MMNLTRNLTIDTLRSKGYKKQGKISGDENSVSNYTDDNKIAERFDAMGLRKQLVNLKPEQRVIIDLAYFNGYTQDEISKEMGIPLGTVKTRMRAAILELRKMLQYNQIGTKRHHIIGYTGALLSGTYPVSRKP